MRSALSKLAGFARWLVSAEDIETVDAGQAGPGSQPGFVQRLLAAEALPEAVDDLATGDQATGAPTAGGTAAPSRGLLRFLFAPDPMSEVGAATTGAAPSGGMSLRRLFARERLEDLDSSSEGGTSAR